MIARKLFRAISGDIMPVKLKLSEKTSKHLEYLSRRLGLRRNIVCRLAIGRSLAEKESVLSISPKDSNGYEFNRYTLTGEYDNIFKALVVQHEKRKLHDTEYFAKYLRNHIERGINLLYHEYERINSPVEFLVALSMSAEGQNHMHMH
jgi:DNA sulfur modification protein DndE